MVAVWYLIGNLAVGAKPVNETVCRGAAGAIAKKLLALEGIGVLAYTKQVGNIFATIGV